jgi:acetylornithine deacetylase
VDPLLLLQDLVAIPSVNPMGKDVSGPEYFEAGTTAYLAGFFESLQVPFDAIEVHPNRRNVIARLVADPAAPTILLDAHQDTVPVEGMTIPPFQPEIRDGRLYGRGACDVKGGLAAMLAAFARLARERPDGMANVLMSCTCDEESTAQGALSLAQMWVTGAKPHPLLPAPPDICVVAEPTELQVVVAHRGASRWKIRTTGRACHSSNPANGVNAIYKMAPVLEALERFAAELPTMVPEHPLCGPATLSVGRIEGGVSVNTVPAECLIEIDRRCLPGEDNDEAIRQVGDYLHRRLDVDFEMLPPWLRSPALSDHNNGPWADRVLEHVLSVVGSRTKVGVPYGTNASRFATTGVPALVFGPGSIAQAHTADEWIEIEQLQQASEIYYRLCADGRPVGKS